MKEEHKKKYLVEGRKWWERHELLGVKSLRMKPAYDPLNTGGVSGLVRLAMDIRNALGHGPLTMVELGTWAGESAAVWAGSGLFDPLYLIDLWQQPEHEGVCEYNMRRFGAAVKMVQGDMFKIGDEWTEPLDVVYLDADHSYEATARVLPLWWQHLKPGGIFAGHDYNPRAWPGVVQGVDEFAAAHGLEITTYCDTSWAVRKKAVGV